jgi:hypothetical protein
MKIEFNDIDLTFENFEGSDERLKRISHLIWKLLEEKFEIDASKSGDSSNSIISSADTTTNKTNGFTLDKIVVPPIRVDSGRNDYDIASSCASAIYQAVFTKLQ